ncbi:MAG TPA: DsbA family protein [Bryobacteraceae bacterium]|jgi:protein-disulfide isomerase|nr:DsbA family protein [Bryobacteraceae bacterium]
MYAPDLSRLLLPIRPEDHVFGPETAEITLVEYGDYECPECGRLFTAIHRLQETSPDRMRIAFRHYPLSGIHPHAQRASEAAEAAGAQGKFWPMHDLLFQHQDQLERKDLSRYGEQLGLDVKRFSNELKKGVYAEIVREDFRRGVQNGVYGTPGLFVNGVRYNGPYNAESMLAVSVLS